MTFSAWLFSAKLAWGKPWLRWSSIVALFAPISFGTLFLVKVMASVQSQGNIVYHYNIYLGIDDVRVWWWVILLPLMWFFLSLIDVVIAYGMYRIDSYFSAALVTFAIAWSFPWAGVLFYLYLFNV